ncbi:MAG: 16S rRNA (guanine(966)-N(2))-methyltransferase RsmD [Magnetovibrionaceae bacterium]
MRIVGGAFRGKALRAPQSDDIRPTGDRAREALFNVLSHGSFSLDWDGLVVADLFCGTGALGLEALSRGAVTCTFVDVSAASLKLARQNAAACGAVKRFASLKLDASRLPPPARVTRAPIDLAFLDAPYNKGLSIPALKGLLVRKWLKPGAFVVVEVAKDEPLDPPKGYDLLDERDYGAARVLFLRADSGIE